MSLPASAVGFPHLVPSGHDRPGCIMIVRFQRVHPVQLEQCVQLREPEGLMLLRELHEVLHA